LGNPEGRNPQNLFKNSFLRRKGPNPPKNNPTLATRISIHQLSYHPDAKFLKEDLPEERTTYPDFRKEIL